MIPRKLNYLHELSLIDKRIQQYEQTSFYMKEIEEKIKQLDCQDFDSEINEINYFLKDLDSHGKVSQLFTILKDRIENYSIESEMIESEFNQLPLDMIDKQKQEEIRQLISSPKTIYQAWKWIRNIQKYNEKRERICFPKKLTQYCDAYLIGSGGFSRVYRVRNIKKNRVVALKVPIRNDECIGRSFLHELNNWVKLEHKNIVKIYNFNILPVLYIEMELCESCLDDMEKPMQLNLALYYIHQIACGLRYAHQHNIAHLDLKPQNILLKNNIPKITDWGLSRILSIPGTTTLGISLSFAAPEQFSSKYGKKDAKTDIWQLGILLYYLLTNSFPFKGNDIAEYGKQVKTQNIKKLIEEEVSVHEVANVLLKCLARNKQNRYKNLDYFLRDIENIM